METGETSLVMIPGEKGKTGMGRNKCKMVGWLGPHWQVMRAVELGRGWVHVGTVVGEKLEECWLFL